MTMNRNILGGAMVLVAMSVYASTSRADVLDALNNGTNSILQYTPGGVGSVFACGLINPQGLAFDSAGEFYGANFGANQVMKFTVGGVGSVFASGLDSPTFPASAPVPSPGAAVLLGLGALIATHRHRA